MNRRRKGITVLVAVVTVLVCGGTVVVGRHAVREWWLLKCLQDGDIVERVTAAQALGEMGSLTAVSILLSRLETDDDWEGACERALTSICEKRGREVIPDIIEGLRYEFGFRAFCANRLAELGPEARAAVPALVEALGDKDPHVRVSVVQALASMGLAARESSEALVRVLHDDVDFVVFNAALALLQISPDTREALVALVKHFVGEEEDPGFVVDDDPVWGVRRLLPYTGKLLDLLRDQDPRLRRSVALVLGLLPAHEEGIAPALVRLLQDEKHFVVEAALSSLERFAVRDAATVRRVTALLRRNDVRLAAIRFLARSTAASREALAAVQEGLHEGSMTGEFLDQLAKAPPETLSRALVPQLLGLCRAGSDLERRLTAVEVLGNMGPPARSAVAALEAILEKDDDLEFEAWAWNTLESIGR